MLNVAAAIALTVPARVWRNAHQMIDDLFDALQLATVISLDHDLNPLPTDTTEPGDGYDVARLLGMLIPCCPLIVHTSNGDRGGRMVDELSRAGWNVERVYPLGDDWIKNAWATALKNCLSLPS